MWCLSSISSSLFLSTPSARRATQLGDSGSGMAAHFYPRPPRGGRHDHVPTQDTETGISIHALREEGDARKGRDVNLTLEFLSTPSARRATATEFQGRFGSFDFYPRPPRGGRHQAAGNNGSARPDFYPRPPRGGRLPLFGVSLRNQTISIHALREEGDAVLQMLFIQKTKFLSTPSARRATVAVCRLCMRFGISIHALREEGDCWHSRQASTLRRFLSTPSARRATEVGAGEVRHQSDFYPRPPRGGRPLAMPCSSRLLPFLSTPSARRATRFCRSCRCRLAISIHALREGHGADGWVLFLSTPSARRATGKLAAIVAGDRLISIHALREEGDLMFLDEFDHIIKISIHALREEGDPPGRERGGRIHGISIHALREEGDRRTSTS